MSILKNLHRYSPLLEKYVIKGLGLLAEQHGNASIIRFTTAELESVVNTYAYEQGASYFSKPFTSAKSVGKLLSTFNILEKNDTATQRGWAILRTSIVELAHEYDVEL